MTDLPDEFRRLPIAHRALHDVADGRPENSRAAIAAAIEAGYGIELDLQLSRDGRAMVFHDYELDRLTDATGFVRNHSMSELTEIPLTGGHEGIPTLAEILDLVAGRAPLLIELKDQHGQMGVTDGRLEHATCQDIQRYSGPLAVMSFNPNSVVQLADLAPNVPRGIVTGAYKVENWPMLPQETRDHLREIPDYEATKSSFISHQVSDLDRQRVADLKSKGAAIFTWTVRSVEQEIVARQVADNITFEGYRAALPS